MYYNRITGVQERNYNDPLHTSREGYHLIGHRSKGFVLKPKTKLFHH